MNVQPVGAQPAQTPQPIAPRKDRDGDNDNSTPMEDAAEKARLAQAEATGLGRHVDLKA